MFFRVEFLFVLQIEAVHRPVSRHFSDASRLAEARPPRRSFCREPQYAPAEPAMPGRLHRPATDHMLRKPLAIDAVVRRTFRWAG
jgi:hypothetical protein